MELTPQDKQRIYEEEKARDEAKQKIEAQKNATGCMGCLGLIVIIVIISMVFNMFSGSKNTSSKSTTELIPTGEQAIIDSGPGATYIAQTKEGFEQLIKAVNAKDQIGAMELIQVGEVFSVGQYTKVLVIDHGFARTKVRILEGPNVGRSGWLPYEFVKRTQKSD